MTATASGFYDNGGASGPTAAACVAAAVGLSGHQAPPQLILPAVLNPGEIYYIAENSMVVCVSQGHHLQHFHQPAPHQILYSAPQSHHQRSSSLPSARTSASGVSSAPSSSAAVVTVASTGHPRAGDGPRKGRYHSGSFEATPQQQIFFSVPPSVYSFAPPAFPVPADGAELVTAPEFGAGQEEVVMEVGDAQDGEGPAAAAAAEVPSLPINILTNQDLSMQHPGHHVAHQAQAHHHSMYQPPTPTQTQQQMVYGLPAAAPQPAGPTQAPAAPSGPTQATPGSGGLPESTEQQLIRHHKLALSMLKNGSLQTAFSNMVTSGEEALVEAGEEEARTGVNNIDSAWVPKASLVERICGNQSDSLQIQCMSRCLSDFKPCMKEKEVDGRFYIRLRQHREMSLNVETEYSFVSDGEEHGEKRYHIVDEHMKEVVEKISNMMNAICEGREVVRLVNRNSVAFYAEPGFNKSESDQIIAALHPTTECDCEKCRRLSFVVKFRCIIDDNRLAKLLEHTPTPPTMPSYNMMPTGHGHPNGLQRPGLEMGMANLTLAGGPHEVPGMSSHIMQQSGPYSPLVSMGGVGQEAAGLVSQAHINHHAQAQQQQQQHPHPQQHAQQQSTAGYYQAAQHAGQAAHALPHSATLAVSASSMFTGQPLLTLTTQHSGAQSPGIIAWTHTAAGQQANQQTPGGHGLQTPEFLFSTYNVANITPGYPPNVASPSASSSSAHAPAPQHSGHHGGQHHHYPASAMNVRHSSGGANGGGRQLGGSGPAGLGGGAPGMGPKSLIGGSGPQKEKNLPPRLQSQHRMAQAAAANAGAFPGPGYGPDFFINGPGPAQPGGYYSGGRGGAQGGGRRGGPPGGYGGSRGARGRPGNYHGGFGMHHATVGPHASPITGPGGPMLHSQPAPVAPTPPDLQADFPHLPRVAPSAGGHQEAMGGEPAVSAPAAPTAAPSVGVAAPGGGVQTSSASQQQPASPGQAAAPLSTYAAVVVHGDANSAN